MKKFRPFMTLVLSVLLTAAFASCSEDNDGPSSSAAGEIAGTYTGDIDCTVMGTTQTFENKTIVITATSDSEVSVKLDSFGEGAMVLPSITVNSLKVTGNDGIYSVDATQFEGTTGDGKQYSGTIRVAYTNGAVTVDFTLQYGSMPMAMVCKFISTSRSGDNDGGDNDDPVSPSISAASEIAGTYTGDIDCTVMGTTQTFEDKTIVITATSDSEVSVKLDSFGEGVMVLPSITVNNLNVAGDGGVYSVDATQFEGTTDDGKQYSGTIRMAYTDGAVTVDFTLQYGAMPMAMVCKFTSRD